MDLQRYNAERKEVLGISDETARQKRLSGIEGEYHLELALRNLYFARTGKFPEKEIVARLVGAVQTLSAESYLEREVAAEKEVLVRLESARKTLASEL